MNQNQATLALAATHQAARTRAALISRKTLASGQTLPVCAPTLAHAPTHVHISGPACQLANGPANSKRRRITPLSLLRKVTRNTAGATAIEYGLLAGLMAIGLAAGLGALGDVITLLFNKLETETETVESGLPASDSTP